MIHRGDIIYSIYFVEDDEKLVSLTREKFEGYDYEVNTVKDFSRVKEEFIEYGPDIVILDINLPKYDGFFWCREIRSISKVPIIFLSARDTDMDQIMGLENGADDYVTKPFSFDVLLTKVKVLLRRTYGEYSRLSETTFSRVGDLTLYKDNNMVKMKEDSVELTHNEYLLLENFLDNLDKILAREYLLTKLWDDMSFVDDNTLSVNINRLRKKLEGIGIEDSIETKRGQGYIMKRVW